VCVLVELGYNYLVWGAAGVVITSWEFADYSAISTSVEYVVRKISSPFWEMATRW
jgi:hypothetical protein